MSSFFFLNKFVIKSLNFNIATEDNDVVVLFKHNLCKYGCCVLLYSTSAFPKPNFYIHVFKNVCISQKYPSSRDCTEKSFIGD